MLYKPTTIGEPASVADLGLLHINTIFCHHMAHKVLTTCTDCCNGLWQANSIEGSIVSWFCLFYFVLFLLIFGKIKIYIKDSGRMTISSGWGGLPTADGGKSRYTVILQRSKTSYSELSTGLVQNCCQMSGIDASCMFLTASRIS